jgi:hypothetical protein
VAEDFCPAGSIGDGAAVKNATAESPAMPPSLVFGYVVLAALIVFVLALLLLEYLDEGELLREVDYLIDRFA